LPGGQEAGEKPGALMVTKTDMHSENKGVSESRKGEAMRGKGKRKMGVRA